MKNFSQGAALTYPKRRYTHVPTTVYLVKSLETANRSHIDRIVKDSPITTLQYVALGVLQSRDNLTSAALARRAFVTPQSMQDMVKTMESNGLISRSRSETNRREVNISITELGRNVMSDLEPVMAELNDALLTEFSEAEVEMFRSLLQRARKNVAGYHSVEAN